MSNLWNVCGRIKGKLLPQMWTKVEVGGMTMAKVICNIGNCKHRLRKPLRTYKRRDGKRCYGCELHAISVSLKFDPDLDVCIASCDDYEPIEEG